VKSDARSARPAGRIFEWQGSCYRPAQDCSKRYGYATIFHQILSLDEERYEEKEVSRILPHWEKGLLGTHTWNCAGELVVMDGLRRTQR
jgi:hypothetical protein